MIRSVLVTGATGFVGAAVMARLAQTSDISPIAAVRDLARWKGPGRAVDYDLLAERLPELGGVDAIIHCAARVHVMSEDPEHSFQAYRKANADATARLAAHAAASGVRRFVFLSTIKVNGENTQGRGPFTSEDEPSPQDAYGRSKLEAELALGKLAKEKALEVAIIRPPLVYGPGVKANFRSMMKALDQGLPLPLGALHNRRSMIAVQNLADLAVHCAKATSAQGLFLARDAEQPTTTEIMVALAHALGRSPRLLPVPSHWLRLVGGALGKGAVISRLCDPLEVDLRSTMARLGWKPPMAQSEGLRLAARAYQKGPK
ncbi:NAD-dependent epimerase/dehydratase family protein [Pseudomonas sp. DC3000-4b1]|uniref:NAD-dependent epimerase/dehydratase family protein n=1 Tax=unclassified Pseudomonas TaxID=196821 RepID=UPI003CF9CBD6